MNIMLILGGLTILLGTLAVAIYGRRHHDPMIAIIGVAAIAIGAGACIQAVASSMVTTRQLVVDGQVLGTWTEARYRVHGSQDIIVTTAEGVIGCGQDRLHRDRFEAAP